MATLGFGSQSYVKVDFEDSWGTGPASAVGRKVAFVSESIKGARTLIQNEQMSGDTNPRDPVPSRISCAGDIVLQPGIDSLPFWTKFICGHLATTGASDPYVHTSKFGAGAGYSLRLESLLDLDTDLWKDASGLLPQTFSGEVSVDGFMRWTIGMVGKTATKATASFDPDSTVDWTTETQIHHGQILAADCHFGGADTTRLISLSWNLACNVNTDIYAVAQDGVVQGLHAGRAALTGTARIYVDSATIWDLVNAGTYTSADFTWTLPQVGGKDRTFKMMFPRILLGKTDPAIGGDGPYICEFPFTASKDTSEATCLEMITTNGNADTTYA